MKTAPPLRQAYEAPKLRSIGSFRDLTRANFDGDFTDADFPDDTPKGDLTFS
jgi:hypothetical protein